MGDPDEAVTLGVEEEFQLLDAATGALVSRGPEVLARLREGTPGMITGELPLSQVETATPICRTLDDVRTAVTALRRTAGAAAASVGCAIGASGAPPFGDERAQEFSADGPYAAIHAGVRGLVAEQFIAGLHVHVGIPDRDRAVAVLDRMRGWLPTLVALAANSPFWLGKDTGFSSWRTVHWWRWPVSGPPPVCGDAAGYDATLERLAATTVLPDPTKVYWDLRLSARFPTVEMRVTDVPLSVDETVMVAGLARALAATALGAFDAGVAAPVVAPEVLKAAGFLAARDGLGGLLLDPTADWAPRPAAAVVAALLDAVAPALDDRGDGPVVRAAVAAVLSGGNGAARQRAAGGPEEAALLVARETTP